MRNDLKRKTEEKDEQITGSAVEYLAIKERKFYNIVEVFSIYILDIKKIE